MANQLVKANKVVDKATNLFSDAMSQVEKANSILLFGIDQDVKEVEKQQEIITKAQEAIDKANSDKNLKHEQIDSNNSLITKFEEFVLRN